jgi:prepilin-type N-terminal cleavage/methylation domain-containing protein
MIKARGFTLIEFTIVLAIAFILIGGALKLTSMLDEAKANDVIAIAGDLSEAVRIFKEKYKMLPGDARAVVLDMIANDLIEGDGLGTIDTPAESNNATDHLYQAGLIRRAPGSPGQPGQIQSRFGNVWIMAATLATTAENPCGVAINNTAPEQVARNVIVFGRLTAEAAREVDTKLDDGEWNTGRIRASETYAGGDPKRLIPCFAMPL